MGPGERYLSSAYAGGWADVYAGRGPGQLLSGLFPALHCSERVDHLGRNRESECYGAAVATKLHRVQHCNKLGVLLQLETGKSQEPLDNLTQVNGCLLAGGFHTNQALDAAVDVAGSREPVDWRKLAGNLLGQPPALSKG